MSRGQLLTLLGGVVLIIGALLPWVSVTTADGTIIVGGYEGDRLVAGVLGAFLLVSAFLTKAKPGRRYFIVGSILALIAGFIIVRNWVIFSTVLAAASSGAVASGDLIVVGGSVQAGIYVSLIGCIVTLVGGLIKTPEAEAEPAVEHVAAPVTASVKDDKSE